MSIWLPVFLASALLLQPAALSVPDSNRSFAGTWRLDPSRSESAAANPSSDPVTVQIAQTDRDVVVLTRQGERESKIVHSLVSNPSAPYSVDGAGSRAYLTGAALVTEGTRLIQGQTVATRETRTLNADGSEMTVDVVVIVQHGYQTRGGRNYGTGRDVYTRITP